MSQPQSLIPGHIADSVIVSCPSTAVTVPADYLGLSIEWSMVQHWFGTSRTSIRTSLVGVLNSLRLTAGTAGAPSAAPPFETRLRGRYDRAAMSATDEQLAQVPLCSGLGRRGDRGEGIGVDDGEGQAGLGHRSGTVSGGQEVAGVDQLAFVAGCD